MYISPASVTSNWYPESIIKRQAVFQIQNQLHPIFKATAIPETEITL